MPAYKAAQRYNFTNGHTAMTTWPSAPLHVVVGTDGAWLGFEESDNMSPVIYNDN